MYVNYFFEDFVNIVGFGLVVLVLVVQDQDRDYPYFSKTSKTECIRIITKHKRLYKTKPNGKTDNTRPRVICKTKVKILYSSKYT